MNLLVLNCKTNTRCVKGTFMKTDDIATFQKVPTENTSIALPSTTVFRSYSLRCMCAMELSR
jgi:hypothetical protein